MTKPRNAIGWITVTLLVLAVPAHAQEPPTGPLEEVIEEVLQDDCPFIQVTPWAPYVALMWDCLDLDGQP